MPAKQIEKVLRDIETVMFPSKYENKKELKIKRTIMCYQGDFDLKPTFTGFTMQRALKISFAFWNYAGYKGWLFSQKGTPRNRTCGHPTHRANVHVRKSSRSILCRLQ